MALINPRLVRSHSRGKKIPRVFHLPSHFALLITSCSFGALLSVCNKIASSENSRTLRLVTAGKSFIYIKKRRSLRVERWGTPQLHFSQFEGTGILLTQARCFLSHK